MLFALPCYSTFRTVTFSEDSEDKLRPFKRGKFCHFFFFDSNCKKNRYKIFTGIHNRILRKSIKKSVPSGSKIIKNQSKMGSRRDLGPSGALLGAQEGSGSIFD